MSGFQRTVFCTLQFEAIHCWPEAPEPVAFLRNPHRHVFHVKINCPVNHNDRDIEFIMEKRKLKRFCDFYYAGQDIGYTSCEMIAEHILREFPEVECVTVSEDNENGAFIWRRGV